MNSLTQWLSRKAWPWAVRKFFRAAEVEQFIQSTDERYLDPESWAAVRGISREEAVRQLETGVQLHQLDVCLLYEWPDSPVRFLIPYDFIGKTIRLSDVGYIGEDDTDEVYISTNRVRRVFVAATEERV